jgi:invasion protein IalB
MTRILATLLCLGLAVPALAQDTPAPKPETPPANPNVAVPPAETLSTGTPVGPQLGDVYVASTEGDWEIRCIRSDTPSDPCQMYQLLKDDNGPVAEISLFNLPEGTQAAAGASIVTPLGTLLTAQVSFAIDSNPARLYPFGWCLEEVGCVARIAFTKPEVDLMKRGKKATVRVVPVAAPDQPVTVEVSLTGFTAAFNKVVTGQAK